MDREQAIALAAILAHDDTSTDTQLIEYFISELEISPVEACRAVLNRNTFCKNTQTSTAELGESCIQPNFSFCTTTTNQGAPL